MNKAIITILGLVGNNKPDEKATYNLSKKLESQFTLKSSNYVNMLPLLVDTFSNEYSIIGITTSIAKKVQIEVLKKNGIFSDTIKYTEIDETQYPEVFKSMNETIEKYEEVIIDFTHGFRHLPILMMLSLFLQNIKNTGKIKHILFGKEILSGKEYEIIDLVDYLDIINTIYLLTSFKENYTILKTIQIRDSKMKDFLNQLREFSKNILANSINVLYIQNKNNKPLIDRILESIEDCLKRKEFETLTNQFNDLKLEMIRFKSFGQKKEYEKLFFIGQELFDKGYLLNSLTILNEAIGLYIVEQFRTKGNQKLKKLIEFEINDMNKEDNYKLINGATNIFWSNDMPFKGLFQNKRDEFDDAKRIADGLPNLRKLLGESNKLRNTFAHADTSGKIKYPNVEDSLRKLFVDFEAVCL